MKTLKLALLLALTLLPSSRAQEARFFRITGPVVATITALSADGYLTWANAPINTIFTVQTAQGPFNQNNWVDYIQVPTTNPVTTCRLFDPHPPTGMSFIPAGSFTMSDTFSEGGSGELPLHTVEASAFWMDKYEVTKALWDDVYTWALTHGYSFDNGGSGKAADHPVQNINWFDTVKWCNARSEKEGRTPAYYTSATQTNVYRTGKVPVDNSWVKWNAAYRLPTEAEWEKAARGGVSGHRFPWADNTISWSRANYDSYPLSAGGYAYDVNPTEGYHPTFNDDFSPYTSPVGYFAPNGYGLYDMAANVYEWCWDWYGSYSSGSQTDPRGATGGSNRVLRGGSWNLNALYCRTAARNRLAPDSRINSIGFRSVLPPPQ